MDFIAFSPDGRLLAACTSEVSYIPVWDVAQGLEVRRLQPCGGDQQSISFSNDGRRLAAVCNANVVRIWDLETSRQTRDLSVDSSDWVNWIQFSKDGQRVFAATGGTNVVQIFDLSSGKLVSTLKGHTNQVDSFALPTDDQLTSTSDDQTVRVWNTKTGTLLKTLAIPIGKIASDGSVVLAQVEEPGVLELWDVRTGNKIRTFHVWAEGGGS